MIPPENAWLRRSNNDIIIGCYSSQQTWQLKCDGREWKGLVGTCPEMCKSIDCTELHIQNLTLKFCTKQMGSVQHYSDGFLAI